MYRDMETTVDGGSTILGQKIVPIESVGAYVSGGRFPLVSTALMTLIPAKVAGVKKIFAATPPTVGGEPSPALIYALKIGGANTIFTVGGAQALAAFAYGTESIPKVDKIVGPGNKYVNEAKRQLFGVVGIDLLAGPSEVLVLADESAQPLMVAYDILAQAEHDPDAKPWVVTTHYDIGLKILESTEKLVGSLPPNSAAKTSWQNNGAIVVAQTLGEAVDYANTVAPEHLELHLKPRNLNKAFGSLKNYGSLFLGENTPVVFSDMLLGPNHVLPTGGASRFTGGLSVGAFLKILTYQSVKHNKQARRLARLAAAQSRLEGLELHAKSAEQRLHETTRVW